MTIDISAFEYKKLKLENDMKITYDGKPCQIYLKTVCTNVINGHHLKRNTLLQIMSIGFSDMIWKASASLAHLTNERNKNLIFFADPILVRINCNQKLSLNKMTLSE